MMADTLALPVNQRVIRDRLHAWESTTDSKAPLTGTQKDGLVELTSKTSERPFPKDLPEDEVPLAMSKTPPSQLNSDSQETKGFTLSSDTDTIDTAQQFFSWFSTVEEDIERDEEITYRRYIEELREYQKQCDQVLEEVGTALDYLTSLQAHYIHVSTKTNALHDACEHLLAEQTRLINTAENISNKLSYFNELDRISSKLDSSTLAVTNESFVPMLSRLDECILYVSNNARCKESSVYLAKFRHCLARALNLIKGHVVHILQTATQQVQPSKDTLNVGDNAFTLFYGKFRANAPRVKSLMEELEQRVDKSPEYVQILADCHQCYFQQREVLLGPSVSSTVTDLATKHARDHCALMRSGCAFMVHVCEDEHQLYFNFFSKPTSQLDEMLEHLCNSLYDMFRPLIIHINHLETLSELCSILKIEMLEEHVQNNANGLVAFEMICKQMLMDVQERLVYRTYICIKADILNYKAAQGDLAYPEKLEMMESIAEGIKNSQNTKERSRSSSMSSTGEGHKRSLSNVSNTSLEVAQITDGEQQEMGPPVVAGVGDPQHPRGTSMPLSPADLHGMWYPTVRRTLVTLSKLYRCIDKTTFQGLSQEALQSCIQSLQNAKEGITKRKNVLDGELFIIKHLLILREQIAPFQADFSIRETCLDFSKFKGAAYDLVNSKSKLFALNSTNALLQFILEGTPQVTEYFVDSKRDVDQQLKRSCEDFIHHVTGLFTEPLQTFLSRASVVISMKTEEPARSVTLGQQPFATPEKLHDVIAETYRNLKTRLPTVQRSMSLYLANRDTEVILFKPIKVNIQSTYQQVDKILADHYTEEDRLIVALPSSEQINLLLSTSKS
ncbi:conserved oligomeric Golgi complex subunit 3-like isoform X2 [Mizuhopecten yessoensis]|uniref:Conserved oligomeric Golgi complex subunit 3 n=1 Tax=Mizuhopecten yessoensis TaxID=6573 RepID=A0A210QK29_MIZYE|nr:conserved oligomeric Golgi complex subunit 3-like isoform X2 [Mizuhopecten yessoensis]OWF49103.1 Conserved oligomeric Golgi complex subunit 3 [Mizuhopecten yessoensis]